MSDAVASESPLARFSRMDDSSPRGDLLSVYERPLLGFLDLRGDLRDSRFADVVAGLLGVAPPSAANTFAEAEGTTICWLGPDELLAVMPRERAGDAARALEHAFAGSFASATDVSGGHTLIALRGRGAREMLEKGCPLDFDARGFGPGRCAQSHLAKAPVLIRLADDAPTYEVVVRRSLAEYLWTWLSDAAAELQLRRHISSVQ